MKKKLLVLFAVLALTQVASAALLDLQIVSLNGEAIPAVKEITIKPSDWINIDIVLTGTAAEYIFAMDAELRITGAGSLDLSQITEGDVGWVASYSMTEPIEGGYWILRVNDAYPPSGGPLDVPHLALDHILMHCDAEPGEVIISLVGVDTAGGSVIVDADYNQLLGPDFGGPLTITQIPEPMTIALLGLGGLFLLRRRK